MIRSISVKEDSVQSKILFFNYADLSPFTSRVVPLFGPNGVGKSTLISAIESRDVDLTYDNKVKIYAYCNSRDNFKVRRARTMFEDFDPAFIVARMNAQLISEGQSLIYSMLDLLDGFMKNGGLKPESGVDNLVLLDEIDSGISIDVIDFVMHKIKYVVRTRSDVQFIFSFNSPRVLKHFPQVLSMYDGKMIELYTEKDMLKVINEHKKEFNKARKTSRGRPKIPC